METMKTWKSKLKKTGASALAAFMLCGSFSAFAQNEVTINDNETGDADPAAGNVKTVTGYQTDKAVGYAANIFWGEMVFVYDRGKYNPNDGTLVGSFQEDGSLRTDVEAGATLTDDKVTSAGYWYGFNGENHVVGIENLSTEEINITATPLVDNDPSSNVGDNVAFTLYVDETVGKEWNGVSVADKQFPSHPLTNAKVGVANSAINRNFAAAQRDEYGKIIEDASGNRSVDTDSIWLNITGEPGELFRNQTGYTDAGNVGEKLGTITLTFTTTDTPAQELTPKAVEISEEQG